MAETKTEAGNWFRLWCFKGYRHDLVWSCCWSRSICTVLRDWLMVCHWPISKEKNMRKAIRRGAVTKMTMQHNDTSRKLSN